MPAIYRGALIGCGFFSRHHLEAWRRMPNVEIVAACDQNLERAQAVSPRAYVSAQKLLAEQELDFVDVITRSTVNPELVSLAVELGLAVICQKPVAPDWDTALGMLEVVCRKNARVMVHENWRWQPWYREAHRMLLRGDVGVPLAYGFCTRCNDGVGEHPYPNQRYFLELKRFLVDEVLVHYIDTARFLFGAIETVNADGLIRNVLMQAEDQVVLTLRHASPILGWIDGHRFLDPEQSGPAMGEAYFEGEKGRLRILGSGDIWCGQRRVWTNSCGQGYRGDSVYATQNHFIQCLSSGEPFESEFGEYLKTFAAVEACYRSMTTHRRVSVAEIYREEA